MDGKHHYIQGVFMKYKERIEKLIATLATNLYERSEIVALSLLAVLSGQSVFLFGPPGTAKSLIARRVSQAFRNSVFFENLMNRFSTPEDIFGPIDIKELKEARYVRKIENFLPTATIAFLDEIWKSSTAILNTLLTIINERKFRNGDKVIDVPLKGIIAASNETAPQNQGLEALDDRLIMRLSVQPMKQRDNFENLLSAEPILANIKIDETLQFDDSEWNNLIEQSNMVKMSKESLNIIHSIRTKIDKFNRDNHDPIYISDRRWQKMAQVMKTSACLCDRKQVMPIDVLVLKNCLWTKESNQKEMASIVEDAVREFCPYNSDEYDQWWEELTSLSNEVEETFFYNSDVYDSAEEINSEKCFKIAVDVPYYDSNDYYGNNKKTLKQNIYVPQKYLYTSQEFFALQENGTAYNNIKCDFSGSTTLSIQVTYKKGSGYYGSSTQTEKYTWQATPTYKKGDCKKATPRTKNMYKKNINEHIEKYTKIAGQVNDYYKSFKKLNENPFVPEKDSVVITAAIQAYIKQMDVGKLYAEQLLSKLNNHIDA